MKAVKVAVLAAMWGLSATLSGMSGTLHGVSAKLRDVLVIQCGMLFAQDTHGNSRGLKGHWGDTIHENFLWSRIG